VWSRVTDSLGVIEASWATKQLKVIGGRKNYKKGGKKRLPRERKPKKGKPPMFRGEREHKKKKT